MYSILSFQRGGERSLSSSGKGKNHKGMMRFSFSLVKRKANQLMEDYYVAKFVQVQGHELGIFAIYDGHLEDSVPAYLQKNLFARFFFFFDALRDSID